MSRTPFAARALSLFSFCLLLSAWSLPAARAAEIDWDQIEKDGTTFLSQYIRIDTTNPPGNEIKAAEFLAGRFRDEGIEAKVFESEK